MKLVQIDKKTTINADSICSISVDVSVDSSTLRLKNGAVYAVRGNWAKHLVWFLKSGAVWTDGVTLEYRK
jgi:hypothetical protein